MIIKRWSGTAFVNEYPEVTIGKIVASGTPDSSSFLRGDSVWGVPTNNYLTGVSGTCGGTITFARNGLTNTTWNSNHEHDGVMYYIVGNTSGTSGVWTGTESRISSYYTGLAVTYKIGIVGAALTTLNINSLGAKTCMINDSNLTTHFPTNSVIVLVYDGTVFRTFDYNTNTTYTAMTVSEGQTATATTSRAMRSDYLKSIIQYHARPNDWVPSWSDVTSKPTMPSGTIVGTTDTQTLENKTLWKTTLYNEGSPTYGSTQGRLGRNGVHLVWADGTAARTVIHDGNLSTYFNNPSFTGSVGIGTTSATDDLHVSSGTVKDRLRITATFENGGDWGFRPFVNGISNGGFSLYDYLNSHTAMVIQASTGYFGIGTTNPLGRLDVNGNILLNGVFLNNTITTGNKQLINATTDTIYVGNPSTNFVLESDEEPMLNSTHILTHEGNFQSTLNSNKKYRSISNFTTVNFNGTTEITCALTENPRGKLIGIVTEYSYMTTTHRFVVWTQMSDISSTTTTASTGWEFNLSGTTYTIACYYNYYLKTSNNSLFINNTRTQQQYASTATSDSISVASYGRVVDVITLD